MELSASINSEIDKRFGETDREAVRLLLAGCDTRDGETVRLAILRLARGKLKRVEDLVLAAQRDYRDVLASSSQPVRTYIVGLLRKGPNWSPQDESGRTHLNSERLRSWKTSGAIFVGGWFMDMGDPRGLYIFTVDSIQEAECLVQSDEAIQSGKLMFEFHPWLAPAGLKIAPSEDL